MKILVTPTSFFNDYNAVAIEKLENFADTIIKNPYSRPLQPEEILDLLRDVDGYIAGLDYITADVINKAPKELKVISRYGAGVDRVDIDAARKRGITVTNTPGVNSQAVCELAFALMLSLSRSITKLDASVRRGEWPRSVGIELYGKTLGIIGLGAIGKKLAKKAIAFGMTVIAYDPYFDHEFANRHKIAQGSFYEVLETSDYISLHLPLTEQTKHIINEDNIKRIKKGAIIINTARGGLIDERAVAKALDEKRIGGLGIDVYEKEPVTDSVLLNKENVIMTPHTGAHTKEAIARMGMLAVDNLIQELTGNRSRFRLT